MKTLDIYFNIQLKIICIEKENDIKLNEDIKKKRDERKEEHMKQLQTKRVNKQTLKLGAKRL